MSSTVANHVRRGFYLDSVALMRLSARLGTLPGIEEAVLMVGTPSNHGIMEGAGLLTDEGRSAGPNDLVIALRAADDDCARAALAAAGEALDSGVASTVASAGALRARSLHGALETLPDANLALISTPGAFAPREARAALAHGLNVMMFSDNVSLDDEKSLKEEATRRGLLVMGPDCGTAYIAGTPLAFANVVPRGDVGVIAASGTGLQEFAVLVSRLGGGISHGIGVGGRDLGDAIGGLSTLAAIDALAADGATREIVLISKPPGAATAGRVFEKLARCGKPVTVCVFGETSTPVPSGLTRAATLKATAEQVCGRTLASAGFDVAGVAEQVNGATGERRWIRGLFSGGTLCIEAQLVLQAAGITVASNAPVGSSTALRGHVPATGHVILDLGADEYTVGRPHPMIEPAVRTPLLRDALADAACAVVLLDVVLGLGAHEDPAGAVVEALRAAAADRPQVIASVCGTPQDPQGYTAQVRRLQEAGVIIAPSNADAARLAAT